MQQFLAVGIDVGSQIHRIAVMNPQGQIIDQCLAHQIAKVVYKLMSSSSLYQPSYKKAA